jgi:hypothetical protein
MHQVMSSEQPLGPRHVPAQTEPSTHQRRWRQVFPELRAHCAGVAVRLDDLHVTGDPMNGCQIGTRFPLQHAK